MKLIINNRHIKASIDTILLKVKLDTGYLDDIFVKQNQVVCTCPFHKNGHERKPACFVYTDIDKEFEYGTFHCFACGASGSLAKLVAKCYGKSDEFGRQWLVQNYGDTYVDEVDYHPHRCVPLDTSAGVRGGALQRLIVSRAAVGGTAW